MKDLFNEIVGTWQLQGEQEFEKWTLKGNDFVGKSYAIAGTDTIIIEYLKVYVTGRQPFYQATVSNQNEGEPINFKLVSCLKDRAIFRNPEHDFPTTIIYELLEKNKLKATISGEQNNAPITTEFEFTRVK